MAPLTVFFVGQIIPMSLVQKARKDQFLMGQQNEENPALGSFS